MLSELEKSSSLSEFRNSYDLKSLHLILNQTGMVSTDSRVCLIIVYLTSGEGNMWFPGNKEELRHGGDTPSSPVPQCAGSGSDRESKCWGLSPMPPTRCAAVFHCSSSQSRKMVYLVTRSPSPRAAGEMLIEMHSGPLPGCGDQERRCGQIY